jgi:hypothetical protein
VIRDKYTHRDDLSRQRKYQLRQRDKGNCIICSEPRVNSKFCKKHAEAANTISKEHYQRAKERK